MKVLTVSVHPDDETLGCGGTLLRHRDSGDELHWLLVTETFEPQWSAATIEKKAIEVEAVAEAYNMKTLTKLGMPTVKLNTVPDGELLGAVAETAGRIRPDIVYVVHGGDITRDHQIVSDAVLTVIKGKWLQKWGIRRVLSFETLSSTDAIPPYPHRAFTPNVFHDISNYLDRKIAIFEHYETERQKEPFPRAPSAIRALARYRGASVGVEYAEAFMLLREVN